MAFKQKASGIPFESHVFYSSIRSVRTLVFAFLKERHVSLTAPTFMDSSRDTLKQTFNQI
ncbi:hypothetical protein [Bacillus atrophaeus]|uniref:hypothetical protein n=1 Tax=Bacillus atrophaeus TaxID=1452 RepID=UPI0037C1A0B6